MMGRDEFAKIEDENKIDGWISRYAKKKKRQMGWSATVKHDHPLTGV